MTKKYFTLLALPFIWNFSVSVSNADIRTTANTLTQAEWALLQNRVQQQNTSVITIADPEQQRLLQSQSRQINTTAAHLDVLVAQMQKAMLANKGTGLTAIQIGIPVRVVIMERSINDKKSVHVFINPELLRKSSTKTNFWERCLSLPELRNHLTLRSVDLTIRYEKADGQITTELLTGMEASVFQQELDHLNGILLTDHHS